MHLQTLKAILNKTNNEYLGLLSYRNTPLQNRYSPVQLNMGCSLKSSIPCHLDELKPRTADFDLVCKATKEALSEILYYIYTHGTGETQHVHATSQYLKWNSGIHFKANPWQKIKHHALNQLEMHNLLHFNTF